MALFHYCPLNMHLITCTAFYNMCTTDESNQFNILSFKAFLSVFAFCVASLNYKIQYSLYPKLRNNYNFYGLLIST